MNRTRKVAIALLATLALTATVAAAPPEVVPASVASTIGAEPAAAIYECASWGCAETVSYQPWLGKGTYRVDDRYVSAHWTTSQSNVSACTYLVVRRANTNQWYQAGYDCGGSVATITFDYWFAIDAVVIESKDNRGRWRYLTVDGPTGQR